MRLTKRLAGLLAIVTVTSILAAGCIGKSAPPTKPAPAPQSAAPQNSAQTTKITYTGNIKPMLDRKCTRCHSPNGSQADLPLNNYQSVRAQITPGSPANSRLVQAVDGGAMSGRLSSAEINQLKLWVQQGAPEKP